MNHDAPITDAVAPERNRFSSAGALEGRTKTARIFLNTDALVQKQGDTPRDHLDADSGDEGLDSLSLSTLDLFEPLMNFYQECPDPK